MEEIKTKKMHTLRLDGQKHLELTGINSVDSFNDASAVVRTDAGVITVTGEGLTVNKFDVEDGLVTVDGLVTGIKYSTGAGPEKKAGFFKKLFQ